MSKIPAFRRTKSSSLPETISDTLDIPQSHSNAGTSQESCSEENRQENSTKDFINKIMKGRKYIHHVHVQKSGSQFGSKFDQSSRDQKKISKVNLVKASSLRNYDSNDSVFKLDQIYLNEQKPGLLLDPINETRIGHVDRSHKKLQDKKHNANSKQSSQKLRLETVTCHSLSGCSEQNSWTLHEEASNNSLNPIDQYDKMKEREIQAVKDKTRLYLSTVAETVFPVEVGNFNNYYNSYMMEKKSKNEGRKRIWTCLVILAMILLAVAVIVPLVTLLDR